MENFWDFKVWSGFNLVAVLLISLLAASILKKIFPALKASLVPTSVLGGGLLIVVAGVYKLITGDIMFDTPFFGGNGTAVLEIITYHALALGFIASTLKPSGSRMTKQRTIEIFNTGVTTVSTYLLQGIFGMVISIVAALFVKDFFAAAGLLLPFGYGQGTGQALNYGGIYEYDFGFAGGKSFGLTIAALGFLSASFGGVVHLILLKRRGKVTPPSERGDDLYGQQIQSPEESPMQESVDKLTVQVEQGGEDAPCVRLCRVDGSWTGLAFHGVPGGHEFTSFVLSLYNAAGPGQPLDEDILEQVKTLKPADIKILVSLSCTMCPELVTAAQRVAAEHEGITAHRKNYIPILPKQVSNQAECIFNLSHGDEIRLHRRTQSFKIRQDPFCRDYRMRSLHPRKHLRNDVSRTARSDSGNGQSAHLLFSCSGSVYKDFFKNIFRVAALCQYVSGTVKKYDSHFGHLMGCFLTVL